MDGIVSIIQSDKNHKTPLSPMALKRSDRMQWKVTVETYRRILNRRTIYIAEDARLVFYSYLNPVYSGTQRKGFGILLNELNTES